MKCPEDKQIAEARQLYDARDFAASIVASTKVIECNVVTVADTVSALLVRGCGQQALGRLDDAIADYTRVVELPDAPIRKVATAWINRGHCRRLQNHLDSAVADYTNSLGDDVDSSPSQRNTARLWRGRSFLEQGKTALAIDDFKYLLDHDAHLTRNELVDTLLQCAIAYGQQGDFAAVIEQSSRIVHEFPNSSSEHVGQALLVRAIARHQLGDKMGSEADLSLLTTDSGEYSAALRAQALVMQGEALRVKRVTRRGALGCLAQVIEQMTGVPDEILVNALMDRGNEHFDHEAFVHAIADFTRIIEQFSDTHIEQAISARVNRGAAYFHTAQLSLAIADCTTVIDTPSVAVISLATALRTRGIAYSEIGDTNRELADYNRLLDECHDAPAVEIAVVLVNRGWIRVMAGDYDRAIADYSRVIEEIADAPDLYVGQSLVNRGYALVESGRLDQGISDFTCVIDRQAIFPSEQVVAALYSRGRALGLKGLLDEEIADYTRLLRDFPDADVNGLANALLNRGIAYDFRGERVQERANYTYLIDALRDADDEFVVRALLNRAISFGKDGYHGRARIDFTRAIVDFPQAPVDDLSRAFIGRGATAVWSGDVDAAIKDFSHVIESLPGAPADQVARALTHRGLARWYSGDESGLTDCKLADSLYRQCVLEEVSIRVELRNIAFRLTQASTDNERAKLLLDRAGMRLYTEAWYEACNDVNSVILDCSDCDAALILKAWELRMVWCALSNDRLGYEQCLLHLMQLEYGARRTAIPMSNKIGRRKLPEH